MKRLRQPDLSLDDTVSQISEMLRLTGSLYPYATLTPSQHTRDCDETALVTSMWLATGGVCV